GGVRRGARGLRHGNSDYRLLCRHVVRVSTPERRSERPQERRRLVGRLPPCVRPKRTTASTGPGAARARQPRAVMSNPAKAIPVLVLAVAVCACTELPSSGPSRHQVQLAAAMDIQVVQVTDSVARALVDSRKQGLFSELFQFRPGSNETVGPGDILEVFIWDSAFVALFSSAVRDLCLSFVWHIWLFC